jgi:single-stranded-DNA-specific exonuclease
MSVSIRYRMRPAPDESVVSALSAVKGVSMRAARLLASRGISDSSDVERMIAPEYERDLHNPFLLKDMDKAVDRILRAMRDGETIMVLGDYDADGVPATVIVNDYFAKVGYSNIRLYIPHRHTEGFGISPEAVEEAKAHGVKLIVTVDCGVADVEEVALANSYGIDVVITDHHQTPPTLPAAYAVVDPARADCTYPFKEICGSAVAFKLVQALLITERRDIPEGWEKWLLDMVGIATVADMMPLINENRAFVSFGLRVARKGRRHGLSALAKKAGIDIAALSEDDIGFSIAPRINAASRMSDPREALELLLSTERDVADARAKDIELLNDRRKGIVGSTTREAKKVVHERYGTNVPAVLALGNPTWMPSLLGLVASSLSREFDRATFLWGREGGEELKGSCRSDGRADVVALMRAASTDVLAQCGGHAHAGGFVVDAKGVHRFEEELIAAHGRVVHTFPTELEPEWVDDELSLKDATARLIDELAPLSPFGRGNPRPRFLFRARVVGVKNFGKTGDHLEIDLFADGARLSVIAFFASDEWRRIATIDADVDIVGTLERGFRGRGVRARADALAPRGTLLS